MSEANSSIIHVIVQFEWITPWFFFRGKTEKKLLGTPNSYINNNAYSNLSLAWSMFLEDPAVNILNLHCFQCLLREIRKGSRMAKPACEGINAHAHVHVHRKARPVIVHQNTQTSQNDNSIFVLPPSS